MKNIEDIKNNTYEIFNFERIYEKKSKEQGCDKIIGERCKFSIEKKKYICDFYKKDKGVFFGSVIEIREIGNDNILAKYFFKTHSRYPAFNIKNSMDSYGDSSLRINSIESKDRIAKVLLGADLRELFVYIILDKI